MSSCKFFDKLAKYSAHLDNSGIYYELKAHDNNQLTHITEGHNILNICKGFDCGSGYFTSVL